MSKKVSMDDIANELGISKTTVSRAFNNSTDISEEQRQNVLNKAKDLNYQYQKSSKETYQTKNIGILVNDLFMSEGEVFYQKIYHMLIEVLKKNSYSAILETYQDDVAPLFITQNKIEGFIVLGQLQEKSLQSLSKYNIPFVVIDDQVDYIDSVFTDNFQSSYKMTNYLIENGHREIGFIGNSAASKSIMERFFGYTMSLEYAKIPISAINIINDRDENNKEISLKLPEKLPTAFFCNNDKTAFELILLLTKSGYKVPEEISVIGFDDTMYAKISDPQITTAHVQIDLLAEEGVRLLLERINNPTRQISNLSITSKLVQRGSVAPKI